MRTSGAVAACLTGVMLLTQAAYAQDAEHDTYGGRPSVRAPLVRDAPDGVSPEGRSLPPLEARLVIDEQGRVTSVELEEGLDPAIEQAAREALSRWRFEPALRDGAPTSAKIRALLGWAAPMAATPTAAPPERTNSTAAALPSADPAQLTRSTIVVEVEGQRRAPAPRAGSDYEIEVGQLEDVPRADAEQLLTLAPGFYLSKAMGEGHPSDMFLRGFNATNGQDIEFSVDGVPVNAPSHTHGHGFADTLFILPDLVERLRVVEGPFDPRQGDFAVAGSAEYHLSLERRGVTSRVGYGSFNRRELSLLWGPHGMSDRTFAGASYVAGDGFGPGRAHRAFRLMAQYDRALDDDTRLLAAASSYGSRYGSAGVVREDDVENGAVPGCGTTYDEQFFCTYDDSQGGATQRHSVSLRVEHERYEQAYEHQVFFVLSETRMFENFTGYTTDIGTGDAQRGDGLEQVHEASTVGARGHYTRWLDWLGHRQEVELGYFARHDDTQAQLRRLRTTDAVPYATVFDADLGVSNVAAYVATAIRFSRWLHLRGGVRADAFMFGLERLDDADSDRSGDRLPSSRSDAFGLAFQPRATVIVQPTRWLDVFTSAGRGTRSSDAQALSDGESAPFAHVTALELGSRAYRHAAAQAYEARVVGFYTHVDNDLVFDEQNGRNTPIGASKRFGAALSGRVTHAASGLDTASSLTYADAYLPTADAGFFDLTDGARLPYIPRWVFRLDASWRRSPRLLSQTFRTGIALGATFVDGPPLPNNRLGSAIGIVDVAGRLGWRWLELSVELTNLFDRRNQVAQFSFASNFDSPDLPASQLPARHFAAGAPRQFFVALTAYLDSDKPWSQ